jgi:L-lactate utilization protein LutC
MTARTEILKRVAAATAGHGGEAQASSRTQPPAVRLLNLKAGEASDAASDIASPTQLAQMFKQALEAVAGRCHLVDGRNDVRREIESIIAAQQATRLAHSNEPELIDLLPQLDGDQTWTLPDAPRETLLGLEVGVTMALMGIAEHGTIVLTSSDASVAEGRTRMVALLPLIHIAILPLSQIVGTLSEAIQALDSGAKDDSGVAHLPPTVTFITGPSRTADIEQELVLGVHGPHGQHVILVLDC